MARRVDRREGHCVVDETPIGNYAELEGSAEWIDRAAARLGIARAQYITLSYAASLTCGATSTLHRQDLTFAAVPKPADQAPVASPQPGSRALLGNQPFKCINDALPAPITSTTVKKP